VLFVGGDFERKGGLVLLDALACLRSKGAAIECDVVTRDPVPSAAGVRVHRGVEPNSPELVALFRDAHVFCLPTLADTFGLAFIEASAAGLPVVATDVGPIPEFVRDGSTGLIVPPGDSASLAVALRRLVDDAGLVARLGRAARELALADHDAAKNATRLVDLLLEVIGSPRR
jgi:glycosyltransferase involved in cell wall biosynthesis